MSALVLFSGGQDSTVCLAEALSRYDRVETVGFTYGQRHDVEMACRKAVRRAMARLDDRWAARLGPDHVLDLPALAAISDTALTRDTAIHFDESGLPNTFVPGRNILFLTYAAALGMRRGIARLIGGMCETDYSGYPDCRDETIRAMETTLRLGLGTEIAIDTPLMWLDKQAIWQRGYAIGGAALVEVLINETHTCYKGERGVRHPWGHGCGTCPACELRARGYERFRAACAADPGPSYGGQEAIGERAHE